VTDTGADFQYFSVNFRVS